MASSKEGRETKRLVGARVSPQAYEILQMALALRGADSMQVLLGPVIEEFATRMGAEPELQAMLTAKREYEARQAGTLERLSKRRRTGETA